MQRPAIVFIHGVRSSSALWEPQLEAVRAEGYEAVAVDLPGHGVRRDERFTLDGALSVVDEAVASVGGGTGPVVVAGLSLGGYVTLEYAARRPERLVGALASACTCDPHGKPVLLYRDVADRVVRTLTSVRSHLPALPALPGLTALPGFPGLAGRGGALGKGAASGKGSAFGDGTVFGKGTVFGNGTASGQGGASGQAVRHAGHPVVVDGATAPLTPVAPFRPGWDVVTDMLGQLAGRSAVHNVSQVDVPLWFVNGKRDHMRLEEKKYLAAIPHARLVVVPGAGHDVSSEAPDEYTAVLLGALADLETGRAVGRADLEARRAAGRAEPSTGRVAGDSTSPAGTRPGTTPSGAPVVLAPGSPGAALPDVAVPDAAVPNAAVV